jgi:hypothetical protein
MAIPTSGSVAVDVPAGTSTEFRIVDATFDENNRYGPCIELELELTAEEYLGASLKYWAKIQQPRLDKVKELRSNGLDDETIAAALKKQGYKFKNLDEPDTLRVAKAGKLYAILSAVEGGFKGAEAALKRCANFSELAEGLIDGAFVGTTKRSVDDKYVKLDGMGEIYAVASPILKERKQAVADLEAEIDEDIAMPDFG